MRERGLGDAGVDRPGETRSQRGASRLHLPTLIALGVGLTFATTVVLLTGDAARWWPLYIIPIVVAAVAHHAPGGLVVTAIGLLLVSLVNSASISETVRASGLGFAVGAIVAVVVGWRVAWLEQRVQALERTSVVDPETKVHRREYLLGRLQDEVRRCDRYGTFCGLVVVTVADIDRFRETFGAYKTRLLLEHVASLIRFSTREIDVVGRFGDAGFAVVLPQVTLAECPRVATRLREVIARADFEGDAVEPVAHCTPVVAWGVYPAEAKDASDLVDVVSGRLAGTLGAPGDRDVPQTRVQVEGGLT